MQSLGPRTSIPKGTVYTATQIQTALFASTAQIRWVYDRLDAYGNYLGDLTPYVGLDRAPVLEHDTTKAAPRSLQYSLRGDSGVNPINELVRVHAWLRMADNDYIDFTLATLLQQPNQENRDSSGKWLELQAVDLCQALIDAQFLTSYSIPQGTDVGAAIANLISGYGGLFPLKLLMPSPGIALPVPLVWEAGKNRYQAITDLLTAVAFMPIWFDELGIARSAPLPDYTTAQAAFTYDLFATAGISDAVVSKSDPSKAYQTVEVLVEDPNRDPFAAVYSDPNPSPYLPNWRPKTLVIRNSTLADQTSAATYAKSQQQASLRTAAGALTVSSLFWPLSQHLDVYAAVQKNADDGTTLQNFVESRWRLTCTPGGQMTRDWQPIL